MKSIIVLAHNDSTKKLETEIAKLNCYGLEYASHAEITHPSAGWVICSTKYNSLYNIECQTYLSINGEFVTDGTGHERFFESQIDAIRYSLEENLRNVTIIYKIS